MYRDTAIPSSSRPLSVVVRGQLRGWGIPLALLVSGCAGQGAFAESEPGTAVAVSAASAPEQQKPVDPSGVWDLRWDRTFAGWQPPLFRGSLEIQTQANGLAAQLLFRESTARFTLETLRVDGNRVELTFKDPRGTLLELSALVHDDRMIGEIRWNRVGWTPFGARRTLPGLGRTPIAPEASPPQAQPTSSTVQL